MLARLRKPRKRDHGSIVYTCELSVQEEAKRHLTTNEDKLVMGKDLVYRLVQVSFLKMQKLRRYGHYGSRPDVSFRFDNTMRSNYYTVVLSF